jgi:hypothetical protein
MTVWQDSKVGDCVYQVGGNTGQMSSENLTKYCGSAKTASRRID